MSSICLLTDGTAQFIKPGFAGRSLVNIIPLRTQLDGQPAAGELKVNDLPASARSNASPSLLIPGVDEFRQQFITLGHEYNEIVVILASSHLTAMVSNAQEAAASVRGRVAVQIIDSQTTSIGLGYLVQLAAEAAANKDSSNEIERLLRGSVPHIYTIFCIPGLSYLFHSGFIDYSQATVGELLGLMPIFSLEDGVLTSLEKARNNRHLIDFFLEFLDEFSELHHISIIQSNPNMIHEGRMMRDHASVNFPGVPFSEHPISLPLATLFGPRSLGVFAIEIPNAK